MFAVPIMSNFNHERWSIITGTVAASRNILRETILWANQRKVFGKTLISQPVIQVPSLSCLVLSTCLFCLSF
jgi:alkylation response protein AidB-like acyl-CoA dehydrogenase